MKYVVMECHLSYAVVLDEEGRFHKVANMRYEVGQTITQIIEMQEPSYEREANPERETEAVIETTPMTELRSHTEKKPTRRSNTRWIGGLIAAAACLMLLISPTIYNNWMPYASVYMTINPEVRIDVNRNNVVIGLEGLNEDGEDLIEGYSYQKKELDPVMDELVDRAIEMGYLYEGGQITLTLDGDDEAWVVSTGGELGTHLNEYLSEKISVTIQIGQAEKGEQEVIIPVGPEQETQTQPIAPDSSYGESDYGEISAPVNDDGDSDYQDNADNTDGDTNYGDSSYEETSDSHYGASDYERSTEDDGDSAYEEPTDSDDGDSVYEEPTDSDDGDSAYEEPTDSDDGDSAYEEPTDGDDGDSVYEEPTTAGDDGDSGYEETTAAGDDGDSGYEETTTASDDGDSDYEETDSDDGDSNYE